MERTDLEIAKDFLATRQQAFQQVFNYENEFVKRVIADLEEFCRVNKTTFHADARVHAALEGRREVFLRIQDHIKLTHEEMWEAYGNGEKNGKRRHAPS